MPICQRVFFLSFSVDVSVVVHSENAIPGHRNEIILAIAPVRQTRYVLLLPICVILRCLRLFELLQLSSILHVEAVYFAALIAHEQLSLTLVQAQRSYVCCGYVPIDRLETAVRSIPNFDTSRMCRDESVKYGIVEDLQAGDIIG